MKIKTISRKEEDFTRERKGDVVKVQRNADPALHPQARAREYVRALGAVKLTRLFAKPFVGALSGHRDGVHCMAMDPTKLSRMVSGGQDGELRCWDLAKRKTVWSVAAHRGFVRGVCVTPSGRRVVTCGTDKSIKVWRTNPERLGVRDSEDEDDDEDEDDEDEDDAERGRARRRRAAAAAAASSSGRVATRGGAEDREEHFYSDAVEPVQTYLGGQPFAAIDHHRQEDLFATASTEMELWDLTRPEPVHTLTWGAESIHTVRFNPVERQLLASCASDRSVVLYDVRARSPVRKLVMQMSSNQLAWNPMEAFNFTVANEDHNCYTFDMRRLASALCVHKDHVSSIMSLSYSPTGKEFATGSYDRTVRIFGVTDGHSREVYHTQRMRRVFEVRYTLDAKYLLSGSDDFNIRLWKVQSNERMSTLLPRQRAKQDYSKALLKRFQHAPEVRRISRSRRTPKQIDNARIQKHESNVARSRKEKRVRAHSKSGAAKSEPARKRRVVKEIE